MGELRGIGLRGRGLGGGPAYLHKKGHSLLYSGNLGQAPEGGFFRCVLGWRSAGSVLRLQGSSGEDGAFALCARDGFDRFQCSLRPVPAAASLRRRKARGRCGVRRAPTGRRIPPRGATPGIAHNRSVLRERCIPRELSPVLRWPSAGAGAGDPCLDGTPRDRSFARRERGDRLGFRAVARGGLGCRRSNARSGPVPLPSVCAWVGWLRGVDAWGRSISVRSFGGRRFGCGGRRRTGPGGTWVVSESPD